MKPWMTLIALAMAVMSDGTRSVVVSSSGFEYGMAAALAVTPTLRFRSVR